jgi:glyoxylase I family protein
VENDPFAGQIKEKPLAPIESFATGFWNLESGIWNLKSEIRKAPMSQIEHFAIYADDSAALKDFYVGTFGLHVVFESGGDPPAYFLADDHGMAIEVLGRPPGNSGVNQRWVCHLALWVDNVPAKKAELERQGIVFETETLVDNDELKTAFFTDPGGNRGQIVWRKKRLGKPE